MDGQTRQKRGDRRDRRAWWTAIRRLVDADRRVRYLATSGFAAALYYATFAVGWSVLPRWLPYLAVALIANLVTALAVYPIHRLAVFRADGPWTTGFLRFYTLSLGGILFMFGGLPLLVEVVHLHVLLAQGIVIAVLPLVNYHLSRVWAFRRRPAHPSTVAEGRRARWNRRSVGRLAGLDRESAGQDVRLGVPSQD